LVKNIDTRASRTVIEEYMADRRRVAKKSKQPGFMQEKLPKGIRDETPMEKFWRLKGGRFNG
jgi:hypothetical protein